MLSVKPGLVANMKNNNISTGIDALNDLLGGKGFDAGSLILLRGEPGTGKTTLAFQIAKNLLENPSNFNNTQCSVLFVCIENKAEIALNRIIKSFFMSKYSSYQDFIDTIKYWKSFDLSSLISEWANINKQQSRYSVIDPEALDKLLAELWQRITKDNNGPLFVVIDSLDAMIYAAQQYFRIYDDRRILLAIFNSFQEWWSIQDPKPTVIFTAEDTNGGVSKNAESYIADTVIELRKESPNYPVHLAPEMTVDWKEDLLFCQVIKGRGLHTQRRPLCYEFVSDQGIEFFPTYAAQGLVSLFHENRPQYDVIQNIRRLDFPSSYPGVEVQEFTRPFLQRMFAVRRYQKRIPPRHPMLVSHVDEYWVEVLKNAKLLYKIPADRLKLFSLADETDKPTSIIHEIRNLKSAIYEEKDHEGKELYLAVPQMGNVGMLVYREDIINDPDNNFKLPETWEELEKICQKLQNTKRPHPLLIETRTYDTLLITALELGWSHGSFWYTELDEDKNLRVRFDHPDSFNDFYLAIKRLHSWIHDLKIVPEGSSVDPDFHNKTDWIFARHWYSTWVDVKTRQNKKQTKLKVKFDKGARFDVARLPVSEAYRERQAAPDNDSVMHHSGLGEWYLMIQNNSENIELGIDIINNLMTSRKITERALSGVELPVVEKFYELYGDSICFATNKTYNEIRSMYFPGAKSRTRFTEYRTVARILFGALQAVVSNRNVDIKTVLARAFKEIDSSFDQ